MVEFYGHVTNRISTSSLTSDACAINIFKRSASRFQNLVTPRVRLCAVTGWIEYWIFSMNVCQHYKGNLRLHTLTHRLLVVNWFLFSFFLSLSVFWTTYSFAKWHKYEIIQFQDWQNVLNIEEIVRIVKENTRKNGLHKNKPEFAKIENDYDFRPKMYTHLFLFLLEERS